MTTASAPRARPVAVVHVLGARRPRVDAAGVDQLEQAAAREIGADDLASARSGSCPRRRTARWRSGSVVAPPPMISMVSCARAARRRTANNRTQQAMQGWGMRVAIRRLHRSWRQATTASMGACELIITNASGIRVNRRAASLRLDGTVRPERVAQPVADPARLVARRIRSYDHPEQPSPSCTLASTPSGAIWFVMCATKACALA